MALPRRLAAPVTSTTLPVRGWLFEGFIAKSDGHGRKTGSLPDLTAFPEYGDKFRQFSFKLRQGRPGLRQIVAPQRLLDSTRRRHHRHSSKITGEPTQRMGKAARGGYGALFKLTAQGGDIVDTAFDEERRNHIDDFRIGTGQRRHIVESGMPGGNLAIVRFRRRRFAPMQ